jgi:hypothetical protein
MLLLAEVVYNRAMLTFIACWLGSSAVLLTILWLGDKKIERRMRAENFKRQVRGY